MSNQSKKEIFIAWSGELGKEMAKCLSEERVGLLSFAHLKPWYSENIEKGTVWFQETSDALESAHYGVVCLMPGSSRSPWINFEAGFLFGRLKKCKLVTFGETISTPLALLQRANGLEIEDWVRLLMEMTDGDRTREECRAWVRTAFPKVKEILDRRNQFPYKKLIEMDQTVGDIQNMISSIEKNDAAYTNLGFQQVMLQSYRDVKSSMLETLNYSIPASQYPRYLISVQENIKVVVKAIALVNIEEQFWQQEYGKEILRTSSTDNIRVFVFTSAKEMNLMSETLQNHAMRYKVYVISLTQLGRDFYPYTKDFSIIASSNGRLLAEYYESKEMMKFSAEQRKILEHERVLDKIFTYSIPLPRRRISEDEFKRIQESVFNHDIGIYEKKTIEMSSYINVEDYDEHEKNHAYYSEMMDRMIEIFLQNSTSSLKSCRILEFGAGTGIFTSRLAQLDNVEEIVAVEIDWLCYKKLESSFKNQRDRVITLHEDSRHFDPAGKFDFIFSSFADHHIQEIDKPRYFKNVKRNLKEGGLLIVGDEFLRDHDSQDEDERVNALEAYHNHIIEKAREIGDEILVELESQALKSGIDRKGDFKISCKRYKELLSQAGFLVEGEDLMGPQQYNEEIGGVYVYTIRCS